MGDGWDVWVAMSGRYRTIVADPPWEQPQLWGPQARQTGQFWSASKDGRKPCDLPYRTLTRQEIAALPVANLAEDNAHLYLWTTSAQLAAAGEIVAAWGFRHAQTLVWCKAPRGIGLGGAFTVTTEFVLFCRRGTLRATKRVDTTWFSWPRQAAHSRKPEAFLDLVEQVSPGPYLEMFARRQRLGWDTWGDEALEHVEIGAA